MKLKFTKMHGAGNDFVVIDGISQQIAFTPKQWKLLADRRFGVGADQMLVVEKPQSASVDFRYRIYNADGGEVEQCGNGARAFVKFVTDKGLTDKRAIKVETMSGVIEPTLEHDGRVTVDMGAPILQPGDVPFDATACKARTEGDDTLWPLDVRRQDHMAVGSLDGQPARSSGGRRRRRGAGLDRRPDNRTPPALSKTRQRRIHANCGSQPYPVARIRARRRRNAGLRHRRMRGSGNWHPSWLAEFAGYGAYARRRLIDCLGWELNRPVVRAHDRPRPMQNVFRRRD